MSDEPDWLTKARAEGRITEKPTVGDALRDTLSRAFPSAEKVGKKDKKKVALLPHERLGCGKWQVGVETASENANTRSWKGRNRRAGAVWKAVRKAVELIDLAAFELRLRDGLDTYARFTRIGPRTVDRFVNLPACLKACEDVVCFLLGIDDSSPLWHVCCDQRKGKEMGVVIELDFEEFKDK